MRSRAKCAKQGWVGSSDGVTVEITATVCVELVQQFLVPDTAYKARVRSRSHPAYIFGEPVAIWTAAYHE